MTLLPGWGPRVPAELRVTRTPLAAWGARSLSRPKWGAGLPRPWVPGIPRRPERAESRATPTRAAGPRRTWTICPGSERKCSFFFTQRGVCGLRGTLHGKKWPVARTLPRRAGKTRNPTTLLCYHEKSQSLAAIQTLPPELRGRTPPPHPNPCSCGSWITR